MSTQPRLIFILVLSLILFGCNPPISQTGDNPTHTPTSGFTATRSAVVQLTLTGTIDAGQATAHPQETRILPGQATARAALTQIANRMATATAKSIHATASAPTPDLVAVYKRITSAVMAAGSPRVIASHLSPDGGWRAELIRYDCVNEGGVDENAYEMLRLVNVEDGVERLVADQLQYCGGIGAYGLGFVYWSADSRYLYYTESAHGVPDGDATAWYRSLFRYDVLSDETIDLRWGPLAPDGVSMAYPDPRELALVIWDLDRGEIARIPSSLPPDSPGAALYGIAWSPDGKSLVYIEAENAYGSTSRSWIVQLDLATFHRQVIYQSESGTLCCVEWRIPGQIQFKVDYWEPQILKVPPMETETLQPSSLWFDRQEDLKDTLPESFLPQIITNGHEILLINNLIKFA